MCQVGFLTKIVRLNLLLDRSVLTDDNMDFFTGSNVRARRFFVFALFIASMTAIAVALVFYIHFMISMIIVCLIVAGNYSLRK